MNAVRSIAMRGTISISCSDAMSSSSVGATELRRGIGKAICFSKSKLLKDRRRGLAGQVRLGERGEERKKGVWRDATRDQVIGSVEHHHVVETRFVLFPIEIGVALLSNDDCGSLSLARARFAHY